MLKIKKTKPYQFRKPHRNSAHKIYAGRVACAFALICSIVPTLALLTYYNPYNKKVSAATLSIDNISTMQEMRPGICYNMEIGDSATLTDTRDDSTYTIAKLSDNKCWMTQNLRIVNKTITSADSDVSANFTIPASSTSGFSSDTAVNAYYGNNTTYGAYYTWCAATAGCKDASGNNPAANVDAASSICPKGWRLPKGTPGTGTNEFAVVAGLTSTNVAVNSNYWSSLSSPSFANSALTVNGVTFPAAGYYSDSSPYNIGSYGSYWSSTADSTTGAYRLRFSSSFFYPAYNNYRRSGLSVRCVADSYAEADTDIIAIVVPPVISIDATSGMNKEVDPNLVTKGEISATISANTTYAVQLSANKTSLTNPNDSDEPTPTNSIPASSNVQAKTNAWGILNQDNSTYSAITSTPTTYYNTEEYNEEEQSTKHTFGIGVSISPTLPAGEYSTTVTITAINN